MYAVFQSGGKQHRVSEGQVVRLEKLELATGATVEFDSVLMVVNGDDVKIGAPVVAGAKVVAVFTTTELNDFNFIATTLCHNFSHYFRASYYWCTNFNIFTINDHQH